MDGSLRCPAYIQRPVHMGLRPVENTLHFVPIGDFLEFETLDRSTRDDKAVEALLPHIFPRLIEGQHVIGRRMARHMVGNPNEGQLHLQRCCAEKTRNLRLGGDLVRHQIEETDLQRTNILTNGICFAHDHNALGLENTGCWQIVRNFNRHVASVPSLCRS